jgi:hypothetical protein
MFMTSSRTSNGWPPKYHPYPPALMKLYPNPPQRTALRTLQGETWVVYFSFPAVARSCGENPSLTALPRNWSPQPTLVAPSASAIWSSRPLWTETTFCANLWTSPASPLTQSMTTWRLCGGGRKTRPPQQVPRHISFVCRQSTSGTIVIYLNKTSSRARSILWRT